jgi:TM2 domain-containing membrane protein YozV
MSQDDGDAEPTQFIPPGAAPDPSPGPAGQPVPSPDPAGQPGASLAGYPGPAYPGYLPPGYPPPPGYPFYDAYGRPLSDKSKIIAGVLGITLGGLGVGRFYTGHVGLGVAQLVVSLVTCGLGHIWGLIDGILILTNGGTDAQGRVLRD